MEGIGRFLTFLGATTTSITDFDSVPFYGMFTATSSTLNAPENSGYFTGFQLLNSRHMHTYQVVFRSLDLTVFLRVKTNPTGSFGAWKKIVPTTLT